MYLIQILAIVIWLFVSVSALFHFKKTVLIWMMARMLVNSQIAVKYNSPGMSAVIAIDMTLILIYFLKYRNRKRKEGLRFEKFPLTGAFWLTLISFLLSSIFAIVPLNTGLVATLKYFISNFGVIFILYKCINTKEDIKLYVKTGVIVAIIITCLGLYEFIFKDNPWLDFVCLNSPMDESTKGRLWYSSPVLGKEIQIRSGMVRAYSTFGIHIAYGTACVFLVYLFMTLLKYKFFFFKKNLYYIVILLLTTGLVTSNSKTSLVGIIVLIFAFYGIKQMLNVKIIIPLLAVIFIIVIYFPGIVISYMSLFDPALAEELGGSSVAMRQSQSDIVLKLFSMNPLFGNGIGSISVMKNIGNNYMILGAESSFFQILPERGLLGLIAYLVTYLSLYRYGIKFIPYRLSFFFLLSLAIMEFSTGILDMAVWGSIYFCVIRLFQLRKHSINVNKFNMQIHE